MLKMLLLRAQTHTHILTFPCLWPGGRGAQTCHVLGRCLFGVCCIVDGVQWAGAQVGEHTVIL